MCHFVCLSIRWTLWREVGPSPPSHPTASGVHSAYRVPGTGRGSGVERTVHVHTATSNAFGWSITHTYTLPPLLVCPLFRSALDLVSNNQTEWVLLQNTYCYSHTYSQGCNMVVTMRLQPCYNPGDGLSEVDC